MVRPNKKVIIYLLSTMLLLPTLLIMMDNGIGQNNGVPDESRVTIVNEPEGGEWVDDFSDRDQVHSSPGLAHNNNQFSLLDQTEVIPFLEDYESYRNGQNLFGVNGWVADTTRTLSSESAVYTATIGGPAPSPSTTIGKIYNPDDEDSYILSEKISESSGILQAWFSADQILHGSSISLMKSDSATPDYDDRVVSLIILNGGFGYRVTPKGGNQQIIGSGITGDTWYRFEIRFDCSVGRSDFNIFNANGDLIGSASNIPFISSTSSIKRIELTTTRDHVVYSTVYWDDITIFPTPNRRFDKPTWFGEDFESYTSDQDLLSTDNWVEDLDRPLAGTRGQFTATTTGPSTMPSGQAGKIYNPDSSDHLILSKKFEYSAGVLTAYFAADNIFHGSSIALMKSDSATPSYDDRVVSLIILNGGFGYRVQPKGGNEIIVDSGALANRWYRFEIRFNCSQGKADFLIFSDTGDLFGAVLDTPFISTADSVKRLELTTTRDHDGRYSTVFWDEINIIGMSGQPTLYSEGIVLPPGALWSTLAVDKTTGPGNEISIEIRDADDNAIQGLIYDQLGSEIDITPLNALQVDEIRLKALFTVSPGNSAILHGWSVEWNTTSGWRDSFTTSLKINTISNLNIHGGEVRLTSGQTDGEFLTKDIYLPRGYFWGTMKADLSTGSGYDVHLDIIDSPSGDPIEGMTDMTGNNKVSWNVFDVDPMDHNVIKIRVRFSDTAGGMAVIRSLSINWKVNHAPIITSLNIEPEVYRTHSLSISMGIGDPDQAQGSLEVSLEYRLEPDGTWTDEILTAPIFNETSGMWECTFSPTTTTPVGIYSFELMVTDRNRISASMEFIDSTVVMNNEPTNPVIELLPAIPYTNSSIEVAFLENGTDIETEELVYDVLWYIDNVFLEEAAQYNATRDEVAALDPDQTQKGDVVRCSIRSFDGLDHSIYFTESVTVRNTDPRFIPEFPTEIFMKEDTVNSDFNITHYIEDIDEDDLEFEVEGNVDLELYLFPNGTLMIIPPANWSGSENVTFTIFDDQGETEMDLTITVIPVNDPPEVISFTVDKYEGSTGDPFTFTVEAEDIDTAELDFNWYINGDPLEGNFSYISLAWTLDYWTNEEWMARINEKIATVSVEVSDGEFIIGPLDLIVKIKLKDEEDYNAAPVIVSVTSSSSEIFESGFVILDVIATDPDGDVLSIHWTHDIDPSFNMSGASINISGLAPGVYQFNVTVSDGKHTVMDDITITVLEDEKKEGSSSGLIIAIIVIVIILVIVALVLVWFLVIRPKGKEKEPMDPAPLEVEPPAEVQPVEREEDVVSGELPAEPEAPVEEPAPDGDVPPEPPAPLQEAAPVDVPSPTPEPEQTPAPPEMPAPEQPEIPQQEPPT